MTRIKQQHKCHNTHRDITQTSILQFNSGFRFFSTLASFQRSLTRAFLPFVQLSSGHSSYEAEEEFDRTESSEAKGIPTWNPFQQSQNSKKAEVGVELELTTEWLLYFMKLLLLNCVFGVTAKFSQYSTFDDSTFVSTYSTYSTFVNFSIVRKKRF